MTEEQTNPQDTAQPIESIPDAPIEEVVDPHPERGATVLEEQSKQADASEQLSTEAAAEKVMMSDASPAEQQEGSETEASSAPEVGELIPDEPHIERTMPQITIKLMGVAPSVSAQLLTEDGKLLVDMGPMEDADLMRTEAEEYCYRHFPDAEIGPPLTRVG